MLLYTTQSKKEVEADILGLAHCAYNPLQLIKHNLTELRKGHMPPIYAIEQYGALSETVPFVYLGEPRQYLHTITTLDTLLSETKNYFVELMEGRAALNPRLGAQHFIKDSGQYVCSGLGERYVVAEQEVSLWSSGKVNSHFFTQDCGELHIEGDMNTGIVGATTVTYLDGNANVLSVVGNLSTIVSDAPVAPNNITVNGNENVLIVRGAKHKVCILGNYNVIMLTDKSSQVFVVGDNNILYAEEKAQSWGDKCTYYPLKQVEEFTP